MKPGIKERKKACVSTRACGKAVGREGRRKGGREGGKVVGREGRR